MTWVGSDLEPCMSLVFPTWTFKFFFKSNINPPKNICSSETRRYMINVYLDIHPDPELDIKENRSTILYNYGSIVYNHIFHINFILYIEKRTCIRVMYNKMYLLFWNNILILKKIKNPVKTNPRSRYKISHRKTCESTRPKTQQQGNEKNN